MESSKPINIPPHSRSHSRSSSPQFTNSTVHISSPLNPSTSPSSVPSSAPTQAWRSISISGGSGAGPSVPPLASVPTVMYSPPSAVGSAPGYFRPRATSFSSARSSSSGKESAPTSSRASPFHGTSAFVSRGRSPTPVHRALEGHIASPAHTLGKSSRSSASASSSASPSVQSRPLSPVSVPLPVSQSPSASSISVQTYWSQIDGREYMIASGREVSPHSIGGHTSSGSGSYIIQDNLSLPTVRWHDGKEILSSLDTPPSARPHSSQSRQSHANPAPREHKHSKSNSSSTIQFTSHSSRSNSPASLSYASNSPGPIPSSHWQAATQPNQAAAGFSAHARASAASFHSSVGQSGAGSWVEHGGLLSVNDPQHMILGGDDTPPNAAPRTWWNGMRFLKARDHDANRLQLSEEFPSFANKQRGEDEEEHDVYDNERERASSIALGVLALQSEGNAVREEIRGEPRRASADATMTGGKGQKRDKSKGKEKGRSKERGKIREKDDDKVGDRLTNVKEMAPMARGLSAMSWVGSITGSRIDEEQRRERIRRKEEQDRVGRRVAQAALSILGPSHPSLLVSSDAASSGPITTQIANRTSSLVNVESSVAHAVSHAAREASFVLHEALEISADVLQFAPLPGLAEAAKVLLNIWDAVVVVDINRLACLRLAERCATLLFSVREEIHDMILREYKQTTLEGSREDTGDVSDSFVEAEGSRVGAGEMGGEGMGTSTFDAECESRVLKELEKPVQKLIEALRAVSDCLERQLRRPFIKRYLKRDEMMREISDCDTALGDAMGMFGVSIQLRILRQTVAATSMLSSQVAHAQSVPPSFPFGGAYPLPALPSPPGNALQLAGMERTPSLASTLTETASAGREWPHPLSVESRQSSIGILHHQASASSRSRESRASAISREPSRTVLAGTPPLMASRSRSRSKAPSQSRSRPISPTRLTSLVESDSSSELQPEQSKQSEPTEPHAQSELRMSPPRGMPSPLTTLRTLHTKENLHDAMNDNADLKMLLKRILAGASRSDEEQEYTTDHGIDISRDMELLEWLEVSRAEMPEAVKTLRRVLEGLEVHERQPQTQMLNEQTEVTPATVRLRETDTPMPGQQVPIFRAPAKIDAGVGDDDAMMRFTSERYTVISNKSSDRSTASTTSTGAGLGMGLGLGHTDDLALGYKEGFGYRDAEYSSSSIPNLPLSEEKTQLGDTARADDGVTAHLGTELSGSGEHPRIGGFDALDKEFIESGIEAMTRLSRSSMFVDDDDTRVGDWGMSFQETGHGHQYGGGGIEIGDGLELPSWTITRYEVDRLKKIGIGFFSNVYLGKWRGRAVAIKVLLPPTPREMFLKEVEIWKDLRHPNVLRLYGASSASGDPPWFFVSKFCEGGDLVSWLRRHKPRGEDARIRRASNAAFSASSTAITMSMSKSRKQKSVGSSIHIGLESDPESEHRDSGTGHARRASSSDLTPRLDESFRSMSSGNNPVNLIRCMHQIAKGMEYLHSQGILHGDLKACNVLVSEGGKCVVSDFGQSEIKCEVQRLSGTPLPHGTLRWQAPELLGGDTRLTPDVDVYAFAICCVEILGYGDMPWAMLDDVVVVRLVLEEGKRPSLPDTPFTSPALVSIVNACWRHDPEKRLTFQQIVWELLILRQSRANVGTLIDMDTSPEPLAQEESWAAPGFGWIDADRSPDLRPRRTSLNTDSDDGMISPQSSISDYTTASSQEGHLEDDLRLSPYSLLPIHNTPPIPYHPLGSDGDLYQNHSENDYEKSSPAAVLDAEVAPDMPQTVLYTPSASEANSIRSSQASSLYNSNGRSSHEDLHERVSLHVSADYSAGLSGSTVGVERNNAENHEDENAYQHLDERQAQTRNERRYRMFVNKEHFHPSLKLALWTPTPVALGAVGYLSKPSGKFITLFNSLDPPKSSGGLLKDMPNLYGYGRVERGSQRHDKRNVAQRGLDHLSGILTFKRANHDTISQSISRRHSFPLHAGHKAAYVCVETTLYRYFENLDTPRKWFRANVDSIMRLYGPDHPIQKEDLFLVIGTLDAPDYALFVSHYHPEGQVHFNVFSSPRKGKEWGTFTTDTETSSEMRGPSYHEEIPGKELSACVVSRVGNSSSKWDTLLVARLRFKPDVAEPTSM